MNLENNLYTLKRSRKWSEGFYYGVLYVENDFNTVVTALNEPSSIFNGMGTLTESPYDGFVQGIQQTQDKQKIAIIKELIRANKERAMLRFADALLQTPNRLV